MISANELDSRLRDHHAALVRAFARASAVAPLGTAPRRSHRKLVWALPLALLLIIAVPVFSLRLGPGGGSPTRTLQITGFTVTAAAGGAVTPRMTRDEAIAAAEAFWAEHPASLPCSHTNSATACQGPRITGLSVIGATFVPSVEAISGKCINVRIPQRENIWVVAVRAPDQSGWSGIGGGLLINDTDGTLAGGDLLMNHRGASHC